MYRLSVLCVLAIVPLAAAEDRERPRSADEVERLSRRLERDARELREEVLHDFRSKGPHRELETHLRSLEKLAERIRETVERKDRSRHIREVLDKADDEVRHIDRAVLELGRSADLNRRAYDRVRDEMTDIHRILYRLRREL
jgi:hypothetical protein